MPHSHLILYRASHLKGYAQVDDMLDLYRSYLQDAVFAMACGMMGCLHWERYWFDDVSSHAIRGGCCLPLVHPYR